MRRAIRVSVKVAAQPRRPEPDPGDALMYRPLGAALRQLPMREREVVVLHYLADLSVEEIARERGLPAGTVKTRLAAGRRRLEQELARQAEAVSDAG